MKHVFSVILIFACTFLFAQQEDTTSSVRSAPKLNAAKPDSTLKTDSTKTKKKYDVDAVINASASDSLIFDVQKKKMNLYGTGELKYKDTDLKSGIIFVDYQSNELEAFGIKDTSDTAKVKLKETPRLVEGKDAYEGTRLKYNFKNQSGFISMAKNKETDKRYEGEKVKKLDKNTYFIENGMFTTCEKDTPDTYFTASEMKVIQKDKIIARWIMMYVGGVPLPIVLPFAVFPNETGRRSGIIIPTYGEENNRGQYFKNFGYFWAISDYMDMTLTGDYYTKGGYGLHGRYRYAERYNFSGALTGGYSKIKIGENNDPSRTNQTDWNLSWYHNQQLTPTERLDVNLQFLSSNYLANNSISYNDLLSQNIVSNATFNKRWDESGSSLTLNYSRTQSVGTSKNAGDVYETLPNVSFSKSITYPFRSDDSQSLSDPKWYELIGYTYSGQFTNNRNKIGGVLNIRGGFQHTITVNASPKIGYFSISPNINYIEKWYNKRSKIEDATYETVDSLTGAAIRHDSLKTTPVNEINMVRTFSLGVSASTRMYGIFNPNVLGIESFCHTLMPSISYSFQPNFSNDSWGYYDSYKTIDGKIVRYDKFQNEVFGGVPNSESQSLSFSLGNIFEIKMAKSASDTTKEQKKIQLLNLNASLGYNFAADSLRLSDLNLSYRTQVGDLLSFSGSSSYTFYDQTHSVNNGYVNYQKVNQFLASKGKGLFRLTNFNFSVSTTLSGEKFKSATPPPKESKQQEEGFNAFQKKDYITLYDDAKQQDLAIPWNLSLSYNFNFSKPTPDYSTTYSNISMNLGFSLTKNWKFTVRGSYDFDRKEISAPQITVYRDLHCWEMNFVWNPMGYYSGFRFEIRMKAPELQDIKVTKSGGLYSGRR
ncbi:MAG: LPS-assembly protein LptD [Bacteroidetes bacterium]|nr:LPS-assembly protein LptD [Bacteroidota bacterium]